MKKIGAACLLLMVLALGGARLLSSLAGPQPAAADSSAREKGSTESTEIAPHPPSSRAITPLGDAGGTATRVERAADGTQHEARSSPPLELRDGKLSARFRQWTLGALCVELTRLTGIQMMSDPELTESLVSDQFDELPLEPALQRLFGHLDAFYFVQGSASGPKLKALWLYPRGRGRELQPVPPELWASTRDIEAQLTAEDPHERARAIDNLVERDRGPLVIEKISLAFADADRTVRLRALDAVLNFELAVPGESVVTLVNDTDPEVRIRALEVLRFLHAKTPQGVDGVRPLLEGALSDPDEAVRQNARALLQDLTRAATPIE